MDMFPALLPMVYITAYSFSNVDDFNNRNLFLTATLLKLGLTIKHFLNFITETQSPRVDC